MEKGNETRKVCIERREIVTSRIEYLRKIKQYREEGYHIVYLDETWLNKNHHNSYSWLPDLGNEGLLDILESRKVQLPKIPSGKGQRLIILHAGGADMGFVPGCKLIFTGKEEDGDYHREMNSKIFLNWFEHSLLPALEEPSVIVLDNASYHNIRTDESKSPTTATRKGDMQKWLTDKNIKYNNTMTKVQLYDIIKRHKTPVRYVTDELAGKFSN